MADDDRPDHSVSRRTMLKRIGAVGAVAWVTPVVTSLNTPAFAASPPDGNCSACGGDFCSGQTICGQGDSPPSFLCGCAQRVDGQGCFCYDDDFCSNRTPCDEQSDCPSGEVCVHTCCDASIGTAVCFPACSNPGVGERRSSRVAAGSSGLNP
jgi:hypothetical protein